MPSRKKIGKERQDKYYRLAKEQGFRARSAFKLVQLNKKFAFLEKARCCIDLCAAPGGWLQVASKYMPVNSVIVGVDLVPIKPIPRVSTFACDITTPQCRNLIRSELKDWKADVVLHDGAPNVGTAWIQDAYSQSELVLMSLKLAVEFLAKGGTFVTKVFRSVDYNNLLWVFNQLFGKVEATKPPSSRNVSAEIFVVCREFHAPKYIDPKFLDPKHVFKELGTSAGDLTKGTDVNNVQANVFQPGKKRRHRDGYADGDYTLFNAVPISQFIQGVDPISVLGTASQLTFTSEEEKSWFDLDITTLDVKTNCEDLKVLGKGDFKALLKWRTALREELGLEVKKKETEDATEAVEVVEEVDEEREIQNELERLNAEAAARSKRERRRANELKTKAITRMQLAMTAPMDIGLEQQDMSLGGQEDLFDLGDADRRLRSRRSVKTALGGEGLDDQDSDDDTAMDQDALDEDEALDSEEESRRRAQVLEQELDGLYDEYQDRLKERDAKYKVKKAREQNKEREEWKGIKALGDGSSSEEESDLEDEEGGGWDHVQNLKAGVDDSSDDSSDSDDDTPPRAKRKLDSSTSKPTKTAPPADIGQAAKVWFSQDLFKDAGLDDISEGDEDEEESEDTESESDEDIPESEASEGEDDFEVVPAQPDDDEDYMQWDHEGENIDDAKQARIKALGLTTPEAVTLAQQLVNRQTTKTHLINDGYSRYSLNDKDGLPKWFLDDESEHYKPNLPVTKEAIAALRAKQRALDARPIKKIAEAKARKKFKASQRLQKALKKAEGVNETTDISEKEKAQQIEKLMRRGLSKGGKRKEIKVVVAKGAHKGVKGRPKGVKGRYQMVDARMRKEVRAKKRAEKATKKRKRN
ncbi:FtsJ-domain-containing protein [Flagelloscypha sp. PMI_526]|nr:FtsJ-domain-containing protein [Flagelloscypha sp. PMI_526]